MCGGIVCSVYKFALGTVMLACVEHLDGWYSGLFAEA